MIWLLAGFFAFVLLGVAAAGLAYQHWVGEPEAAVSLAADEGSGSSSAEVLGALGRVFGSRAADVRLRGMLFRAGYRTASAVATFHGVQVAAGLGMAIVFGWIALLGQGEPGSLLLPACGAIGFGYLAPKRALAWQAARRAQRLRSALPSALDLIVLGLEAGQTIDQGVLEAARSIDRVYPDLASELSFCSLEMRAGTPRGEALRRMGERCGDAEIRKLVAVLVDGERFGSSLGPALRSHAHYLRTRMRHAAQEKSRKLTVKLVLPVFFLIFPSILLVTLGPAYLQLSHYLAEMMK